MTTTGPTNREAMMTCEMSHLRAYVSICNSRTARLFQRVAHLVSLPDVPDLLLDAARLGLARARVERDLARSILHRRELPN